YSPGDAVGALEVCTDIGDKTRFVRHTSQAMFKAMDELDPAQSSAHVVNKVEGTISASLGGKRPKMTVLHKLTCCTVSHTTSRDLNGALLRGLFLGAHTKCKTPSVDVQSVPRCMPLDHHDSQVYQKENPSALAFMGSLCRATAPF
ncbi:MAG: hypothetical protein KBF33_13685, partial [Comamonas sp.]|nr:hypothetical protein [Comamonas sp.]